VEIRPVVVAEKGANSLQCFARRTGARCNVPIPTNFTFTLVRDVPAGYNIGVTHSRFVPQPRGSLNGCRLHYSLDLCPIWLVVGVLELEGRLRQAALSPARHCFPAAFEKMSRVKPPSW
jgi:hypothetical protein